MTLLLKDFVWRWRWVFPVVAVFAILAGLHFSFLLFVMFAGPVVLSYDVMRGALKVQATLPVSGKALARLAWFEAVVLFPLFCAPIVTIVQSFAMIATGGTFGAYAETLFFYILSIGGASLLFVLLMMVSGFQEPVKGSYFSGIWGLSMLVSGFGLKRIEGLSLHWAGAPLLLLAIGLSAAAFLLAERFVRATADVRTKATMATSAYGPITKVRIPGRWVGFATPWLHGAGFAATMYLSMVVIILCIAWLHANREAGASALSSQSMAVVAVGFPGAMVPMQWLLAIRALRALPLSRTQLAALFLSLSCTALCVTAILAVATNWLLGSDFVSPQGLAVLIALPGIAVLACALSLAADFGTATVIFPLIVGLGSSMYIAEALSDEPFGEVMVAAIPVGFVFFWAGFFCLRNVLGTSSNAYRRKLPEPGQPRNQR